MNNVDIINEYSDSCITLTASFTPTELREIIARRREVEAVIGTDKSIGVVIKIADMTRDLLVALQSFQVTENARKLAIGDTTDAAEDEDDEDDEDDDND